MPTYTLEIQARGLFATDIPSLKVFADGVLDSTHTVSATGTTISLVVTYAGALPSSLSFQFDDALAELGRSIKIDNVSINDRHVNTNNFLSSDSLLHGASSTLDMTNSGFLFDDSEPDASEFANPTIALTTGNDTLRITNSTVDNVLDGLDGRDVLYTGSGNDKINGGAGKDLIRGGSGDDLIFGGTDIDKLYGQDGNDEIYGGEGNDRIQGDAGDDELHGGTGNDRISGNDGDDILVGGDGNDKLNGGAGNNMMFGDAGEDTLTGGNDNDAMDGGADDDVLYGGNGNDFMNGGSGNDFLAGNNDIDNIHGDDGDDQLFGGAGNDILYGDAGDDTLRGGDGFDIMWGGSGSDTYVMESDFAFSDIDLIRDFNVIEGDILDISDLITNSTGVLALNLLLTVDNGDTLVNVDADGILLGTGFETVATIEGVVGLDAAALVLDGSIVL